MLNFTGERVVPGRVEPDLWDEHVSRYYFARLFAVGRSVLDVGCGSGYGAACLGEQARQTLALDCSEEAIRYAVSSCPQAAAFLVASADHLPLPDGVFDLVTAFEVVEHVADPERLVREAARVVAKEGVFLVSTPNKTYYAETRAGAGPNPYHLHEFEFLDFRDLLRTAFPCVSLIPQNHVEAIAFPSGRQERALSHIEKDFSPETGHFYLGVCSFREVEIPTFVYAGQGGNLLKERADHIRIFEAELTRTRADYSRLVEEFEKQNEWARSLERELSETKLGNSRKLAEIAGSKWFRLGRWLGLGPRIQQQHGRM